MSMVTAIHCSRRQTRLAVVCARVAIGPIGKAIPVAHAFHAQSGFLFADRKFSRAICISSAPALTRVRSFVTALCRGAILIDDASDTHAGYAMLGIRHIGTIVIADAMTAFWWAGLTLVCRGIAARRAVIAAIEIGHAIDTIARIEPARLDARAALVLVARAALSIRIAFATGVLLGVANRRARRTIVVVATVEAQAGRGALDAITRMEQRRAIAIVLATTKVIGPVTLSLEAARTAAERANHREDEHPNRLPAHTNLP